MKVFAPGKLFVIGEYAVLDGGDAIVAAVDRGVCCTIFEGEAIESPHGDTRFVAPALKAVSAPPRHYRFEAWNPLSFPHKVGLGSSAAACVAAVGAGRLARGETPSPIDLITAMEVHREVQGSGSGRDVMASFYGGISRFSEAHQEPLASLPISVIHSGKPADTGPRVKAYLAVSKRQDFLRAASELVDAFEADPILALDEYGRLLEKQAEEAGFNYLTPAHIRIRDLARQFGGSAKPSGAGGGDIAIALIPQEDKRAAFVDACTRESLLEVPAQLSQGLHWEPENA